VPDLTEHTLDLVFHRPNDGRMIFDGSGFHILVERIIDVTQRERRKRKVSFADQIMCQYQTVARTIERFRRHDVATDAFGQYART
jgi:hypothetical protein